MVNDHLSDFVTRVRNGYRAGLTTIEVPTTNLVEKVATVLVKRGYLASVAKKEGANKILSVELKYQGGKPVIMGISRVSKPSVRIYSKAGKVPRVWGSLGTNILSTNKGVMDQAEAKKLKTGGEILLKVW